MREGSRSGSGGRQVGLQAWFWVRESDAQVGRGTKKSRCEFAGAVLVGLPGGATGESAGKSFALLGREKQGAAPISLVWVG
jgi:hypothetical protein